MRSGTAHCTVRGFANGLAGALSRHVADGALLRADVHHVPWPLQRAGADIEENVIAGPQGIELAGPPAFLHFARRLDVVVWNVERVHP